MILELAVVAPAFCSQSVSNCSQSVCLATARLIGDEIRSMNYAFCGVPFTKRSPLLLALMFLGAVLVGAFAATKSDLDGGLQAAAPAAIEPGGWPDQQLPPGKITNGLVFDRATATATAMATPTAEPTPPFAVVRGHYYASRYESGDINEYDSGGTQVGLYTVPSALGEEVKGIAVGWDGLLYANMSRGSSGFAVLALNGDRTVTMTYAGPNNIAGNLDYGKIATDRQYLYVCGGNGLTRFRLGDPSSGTTIYTDGGIFDVRPLPNGNLFVASAYNIVEITNNGTVVRHIQLSGGRTFSDIRG